jgi:hypothetical protein
MNAAGLRVFEFLKYLIKRIRDSLFSFIELLLIICFKLLPRFSSKKSRNILFLPRPGRGLKISSTDDSLLRTFPHDKRLNLVIERFNRKFWILGTLKLMLLCLLVKKPNIILLQYVKDFHKFPSMRLLFFCQSRGAEIVKIWLDSYSQSLWEKRILAISDLGTINFVADSPEFIPQYSKISNQYYYFIPLPTQAFPFVPFAERKIFLYYSGGVSNVGIYSDRGKILNLLEAHNIEVAGYSYDRGNPGTRPSYDTYRSELSGSLVALNFTGKGTEDVLVGRTWEILSSGVLLLQNKSQVFGSLFIPGVHYIEFDSEDHLLEILLELRSKPKLIAKISMAGMERYHELYKNEVFWNKIIPTKL